MMYIVRFWANLLQELEVLYIPKAGGVTMLIAITLDIFVSLNVSIVYLNWNEELKTIMNK